MVECKKQNGCLKKPYKIDEKRREAEVKGEKERYCSHEVKRHLLLGREAVTNLDSILKSRDSTLLTKVHLIKAMVFPVVMCGCESWIVKKTEHQRKDAFNCGDGEDS